MPTPTIPIIHEPSRVSRDSEKTESTGKSEQPVSKSTRFAVPTGSRTPRQERLFPAINSPQVIRPPSSSSAVNRREKVRLAPHHSALDWERYKHENDVKRIDPLCFPIRITKDELAKHSSQHDCWISLGGKIYNISSYLEYHPGGVSILVKHAGKDCTAIFMKYHRWVNYERILDECFIGFVVR